MKRSSRAWILLPVSLIVIAAIGIVMSNYQKEAGIAGTNKGGAKAVSATAVALDYSLGDGESDYLTFAEALLVATTSQRELPLMSAADTRLSHALAGALDCLYAAREAWQTEIDQAWDPSVQGLATYWRTMHPSLELPSGSGLTAADIRRLSTLQASQYLDRAIGLVG